MVNNIGHVVAFATGGGMAYAGLSPLFSSGKKFDRPEENAKAARLDLTDLMADKRDKLYVGLGTASALLATESMLVLVKRFLLYQE